MMSVESLSDRLTDHTSIGSVSPDFFDMFNELNVHSPVATVHHHHPMMSESANNELNMTSRLLSGVLRGNDGHPGHDSSTTLHQRKDDPSVRKSVLHNLTPSPTPTVITLNPLRRTPVSSAPHMMHLTTLTDASSADASNWPLLNQTNPPTPDHVRTTYRPASPQVMPYQHNPAFMRAPGVPMPPIPPNLMMHNQMRVPFELRQPERRRGRPAGVRRPHPYNPQMSQQRPEHTSYPVMKTAPEAYLSQLQQRPPHQSISHTSPHPMYQYQVANGPRPVGRPSLQYCNPSVFTQQQRGQVPVSSHQFINMVDNNMTGRRIGLEPRPSDDIRHKVQGISLAHQKDVPYMSGAQWYDPYREHGVLPPISIRSMLTKERTVENILEGRYPNGTPYMMNRMIDRPMMGPMNGPMSGLPNGMPRYMARPSEQSIEILRSALSHNGQPLPTSPHMQTHPYHKADAYEAFCRTRSEGMFATEGTLKAWDGDRVMRNGAFPYYLEPKSVTSSPSTSTSSRSGQTDILGLAMSESFGEEVIECVEVIDDEPVDHHNGLPGSHESAEQPTTDDSQYMYITIDENAENLTGDALLQYLKDQGLEVVETNSQQSQSSSDTSDLPKSDNDNSNENLVIQIDEKMLEEATDNGSGEVIIVIDDHTDGSASSHINAKESGDIATEKPISEAINYVSMPRLNFEVQEPITQSEEPISNSTDSETKDNAPEDKNTNIDVVNCDEVEIVDYVEENSAEKRESQQDQTPVETNDVTGEQTCTDFNPETNAEITTQDMDQSINQNCSETTVQSTFDTSDQTRAEIISKTSNQTVDKNSDETHLTIGESTDQTLDETAVDNDEPVSDKQPPPTVTPSGTCNGIAINEDNAEEKSHVDHCLTDPTSQVKNDNSQAESELIYDPISPEELVEPDEVVEQTPKEIIGHNHMLGAYDKDVSDMDLVASRINTNMDRIELEQSQNIPLDMTVDQDTDKDGPPLLISIDELAVMVNGDDNSDNCDRSGVVDKIDDTKGSVACEPVKDCDDNDDKCEETIIPNVDDDDDLIDHINCDVQTCHQKSDDNEDNKEEKSKDNDENSKKKSEDDEHNSEEIIKDTRRVEPLRIRLTTICEIAQDSNDTSDLVSNQSDNEEEDDEDDDEKDEDDEELEQDNEDLELEQDRQEVDECVENDIRQKSNEDRKTPDLQNEIGKDIDEQNVVDDSLTDVLVQDNDKLDNESDLRIVEEKIEQKDQRVVHDVYEFKEEDDDDVLEKEEEAPEVKDKEEDVVEERSDDELIQTQIKDNEDDKVDGWAEDRITAFTETDNKEEAKDETMTVIEEQVSETACAAVNASTERLSSETIQHPFVSSSVENYMPNTPSTSSSGVGSPPLTKPGVQKSEPPSKAAKIDAKNGVIDKRVLELNLDSDDDIIPLPTTTTCSPTLKHNILYLNGGQSDTAFKTPAKDNLIKKEVPPVGAASLPTPQSIDCKPHNHLKKSKKSEKRKHSRDKSSMKSPPKPPQKKTMTEEEERKYLDIIKSRLTGWERGWTPKEIIGINNLNNNLVFLLRWTNSEQTIVLSEEAKQRCPQLVIKFYEEHSVFDD